MRRSWALNTPLAWHLPTDRKLPSGRVMKQEAPQNWPELQSGTSSELMGPSKPLESNLLSPPLHLKLPQELLAGGEAFGPSSKVCSQMDVPAGGLTELPSAELADP